MKSNLTETFINPSNICCCLKHAENRNSRPLLPDSGYWAEALPLMDAPLCAVIDPIRDYRWHALRCGGPETASFLCEMPGKIYM